MKLLTFNFLFPLSLLLAIITIIIFIITKLGILSTEKDAFYIVLIGPMSGTYQNLGQSMVKGVNLYLNDINKTGGINGKPVKLIILDDQNDKILARRRALEVVEQNKALIVIGHAFSSTSISAGAVYKKFKIPAISGSATTNAVTKENDWYFRTVFSNHSQAAYLANYVKKVIQRKVANIIFDQDEYGSSLATSFEKSFKNVGGKINHKLRFNVKNVEKFLNKIAITFAKDQQDKPKKSEIIFLATHSQEAAKIIVKLRRLGVSNLIVGSEAISEKNFAKSFKIYHEEQSEPGYFSKNIYAPSPIIFDVANEKTNLLRNEFIKQHNEEPNWYTATYYDAAAVAVQAIKMSKVQGTRIAKERQQIRDYLTTINSIENSVSGMNGKIYFDKYGNIIKPVAVGVFNRRHFISALTQFEPINIQIVLEQKSSLNINDNKILTVDNNLVYQTKIVYTGIDINAVSNLDIKNSSYTVDFYLWFRYRGEFDSHNIEFINSVKPIKLGEPIDKTLINDTHHEVYRIKANFKGDFLFQDYPFDQQKLAIKFRHVHMTREKLIYVVDIVGLRQTSSEAILDKFNRTKALDSIGNWKVGNVRIFQDITKSESTLGNPLLFDSDGNIEYSRFNTVIQIHRDVLNFSIKNLFPLFVIVLLSYFAFFIPSDQLSVTNAIVRGSLLTAAFFHLKLSNDLPGVGYLVALDYVFYIIYILIIFGIIITTALHSAHKKKNIKREKQFKILAKTLYPTTIIISTMWFIYHYF
ncbi:ABC transporter substrate-binding protein [Candidatus Halobeggiatoa sp. HSG11]|nr:ABC transporter substrate-binding protein [Candidatus Halobeggiatoa sp. HSG11]